jgi:Ser/Thr protein kinase RdoA (MazF antagonist)
MLEPLEGVSLGTLAGRPLVRAHRALGAVLARLHDLPAPAARLRRFERDEIAEAADLISRACPRARATAVRLARTLERRATSDGDERFVHGDLHPKNVLVARGGVGLIDLDQAGRAPAATDLGGVLAGLRCAVVLGALPAGSAAASGGALLRGYEQFAELPSADALRWYTAAALLVERAARAVHRVRPRALERLAAILDDGHRVLGG